MKFCGIVLWLRWLKREKKREEFNLIFCWSKQIILRQNAKPGILVYIWYAEVQLNNCTKHGLKRGLKICYCKNMVISWKSHEKYSIKGCNMQMTESFSECVLDQILSMEHIQACWNWSVLCWGKLSHAKVQMTCTLTDCTEPIMCMM